MFEMIVVFDRVEYRVAEAQDEGGVWDVEMWKVVVGSRKKA